MKWTDKIKNKLTGKDPQWFWSCGQPQRSGSSSSTGGTSHETSPQTFLIFYVCGPEGEALNCYFELLLIYSSQTAEKTNWNQPIRLTCGGKTSLTTTMLLSAVLSAAFTASLWGGMAGLELDSSSCSTEACSNRRELNMIEWN